MKRKDIINHIRKTNSWKLDSYTFPKLLYYWMGKRIDLENYRKIRLQESSNHEKDFIHDLLKLRPEIKCIREFPLPIHSLETWRKYYPKEDHIFFSLDFFFPYTSPGIIVEIDGTQHQRKREYDQARDDYLQKEYGLITFRVDEYGYYWPERSKNFLNNLVLQLDTLQADQPFPIPKLEEFIEKNWIDNHEYELNTIYNLQLKYGENIKKIKITKENFYNISEGKIYNTKPYLDNFNLLYKSICGQEIELISS